MNSYFLNMIKRTIKFELEFLTCHPAQQILSVTDEEIS